MKNKNKSQILRSNPSVTTTLLVLCSTFFLLLQINPTAAAAVYEPTYKPYVPPELYRDGYLQQTKFESFEYPTLSRQCHLGLYYFQSEDQQIGSNYNEPIVAWEGVVIREGYDDKSVRSWVDDVDSVTNTVTACYNVKNNVDPFLVDKIDAYYLSGWCGCNFYMTEDCTRPPDRDWEHQKYVETINCNSPKLYEYEKYNSWRSNSAILFKKVKRKVKSFSCYQSLPSIKTEGARSETVSCKITLGNGGDQRPAYNEIDKANGADLVISREYSYNFHVFGAFRPLQGRRCERVSDNDPFKDRDGIVMRRWEIEGCTCEFFTNDKCEGNPLVRDGTSFYVNRNAPRYYQFQVIRSFRCEHFWGPPMDRQRNLHSRECIP
ncbi:hypothetical protein TWF173_007589 [Orbilia oligospora]|nr:hypothetical protein TWF173_007589 [Orbilia oligospora]